jgi:hypothetical protein
MTMARRSFVTGLGVVAMIAALAYLRDPQWLAGLESGFRAWETGPDGRRYRWTSGHASFFVPSTMATIVIPAKTTFAPGDPPVQLSVSIDDRPVMSELLTDERWLQQSVQLPPPGSRRLRRIDLRVDRVRAGNRGVQVGEVLMVEHASARK